MERIEQYVINFITTIRIDRKLSQKELAQILGVSNSFIGNVENPHNAAKYNLKHINLLAGYFGISPQIFFPVNVMPTGKLTVIKKQKSKK